MTTRTTAFGGTNWTSEVLTSDDLNDTFATVASSLTTINSTISYAVYNVSRNAVFTVSSSGNITSPGIVTGDRKSVV